MMMAGASVVQVGAAVFADPLSPIKIIEGLENYCIQNNINNISAIAGAVKLW